MKYEQNLREVSILSQGQIEGGGGGGVEWFAAPPGPPNENIKLPKM